MVGKSLGHYEILEALGSGGMGEVYRARDTTLKRDVAIKVLPEDLSADEEHFARLEREAHLLASLNHPNIVTVYSVEKAEGVNFITMELVEGNTLADLIPRGGMKLEEFFGIAVPLADALSTAHDRGIIHRDLKPGNVMVSDDGRLKILDFGLAKLRLEHSKPFDTKTPTEPLLTGEGQVLGTIPYMSPEQIRGIEVDHRSDTFSTGIILYEMATGERPFKGTAGADYLSAILRDTPRLVTDLKPGLPNHLGRIIRLCLEKDPDRRYQTCKDLRNELDDLRREITSEQLAVPAATLPPDTKRSAWLIGGAAAVVTILALGIWALMGNEGPPAVPKRFLEVSDFQNFTGDPHLDYMTKGFRDSVMSRLTGLEDFYVIPADIQTSTFFSGGDLEAELQLQGGLHKSGDRLRISYRVIHRKQGQSLGGNLVEGTLEQLFDLQDQVANDVVQILRSEFGDLAYAAGENPTDDVTAFHYYLQGRDYLRRFELPENIDYAIDLFETSLSRVPDFALAYAGMGEAYWSKHTLTGEREWVDKAMDACETAADINPELAEAHVCLGTVHHGVGQYEAATAELLRAIELDPTNGDAYRGLGIVEQTLGSPAEAEEALKQAVALHPTYWAGYTTLGGFYILEGRYEDAIEPYEHAVELAPDSVLGYVSLGAIYYWLGRYKEANEALSNSIAIRPTYAALTNLGSLHFIQRRFDEAIQTFEDASAFDDATYVTYGNLAKAYHWAGGRETLAAATFKRASDMAGERLEINPRDTSAHVLLAHYQAMLGERETAVRHLEFALEYSDNLEFQYLAGLIYNQLGNPEKALGYLKLAVEQGYSIDEIRDTIEPDKLRGDPRFEALLESR